MGPGYSLVRSVHLRLCICQLVSVRIYTCSCSFQALSPWVYPGHISLLPWGAVALILLLTSWPTAFLLPLDYNCSSFMVLLKTYRHVFFCDLWSVVEYRKLLLQTKNGLIATRSCNKKKGVCSSCMPFSQCTMSFSSDTPTLGFPVGSEICLEAVLQPTSPSFRFSFFSSWVEFPICQSYLSGIASQPADVWCRRD